MAEEKNKWIDAITKLTKLTQEGKLKWSSASSTDVLVSDDVQQVEAVFTATHKDKRLRLYKKRFKVEEPSNPWFGATSILSHRKYPYWTAQIYLELVDTHGHSLWTFPEVSALSDLLTSVKYQVSGVKDFLNDLLEEQIAEQAG
jgi:hypothetical protein